MSVAKIISGQLERASWIRRMFEEGDRLRAERGAAGVFDFTLGNPEVEPPEAALAALRRVVERRRPHSHGYMPNAGFPEVREIVARRMRRETGLPYTAEHIVMTAGSAAAMNVVLKSLLDPGDEVVVLLPYFPEYRFYIENHAGRVVPVGTDENFLPRIDRIAGAVTPRTKAIILNSPNNPSGVVYPAEILKDLDDLIESLDQPLTVINDEPYKALVFDGVKPPEAPALIRRTVTAFSWSKAMAVSGERIGYLAISPRLPEAEALHNACTFTNRILGYINAPAIWQWVVAEAADATVDVQLYQRKRDLMCAGLERVGYNVRKPQGAFYVFCRSPIPDDVAFIRILLKEGILAVPGSGFGRGGFFRLSLTVPADIIERSLPGFERALQAALTR